MSREQQIGEAVASLTTRLDGWGIDDAQTKAHEYVTDMLRNGWRPIAPAAFHEQPGIAAHNRAADPTPYVGQVRAALHDAKTATEEDSSSST